MLEKWASGTNVDQDDFNWISKISTVKRYDPNKWDFQTLWHVALAIIAKNKRPNQRILTPLIVKHVEVTWQNDKESG